LQPIDEKYENLKPLGTGGFAKVFSGKRKVDNINVAIKHMTILECAPESDAVTKHSVAEEIDCLQCLHVRARAFVHLAFRA
jgi:hypothetical protein